jgi:hypothetical protein
MATTSTTDFATSDVAANKAAMPTPVIRQHPIVLDNGTGTPVHGVVAGISSGSTTPCLAHSFGSGSGSGGASAASDGSQRAVGGIHQMSSVKLPGYWSHARS